MFPEFFLNYVEYFQPLNVFRYITFRTGGATLTALIISFLLKISLSNYVILIATIMSVLILEILNTSIESIVDLVVKKEFSILAKISKDTSAGAVLLASINSVIIAVYIFVPKIKLLF